MGLLSDYLNSEDGRMTMGLLAAAGPQTDPNKTGFGARMQQAVGSVDEWKQQQAAAKRAKTQEEFMQFQMEQARALAAQQKASAEQAAKVQQAIPGLFRSPQSQAQVSIPQMDGVDMFSQGANVEQPSMRGPRQFDMESALKLGLSPDQIEKYAKLNDLGKQEVARTVKGIGPDGREFEYQLDKFGNKVGEGFGQYKAPIMQDLGGSVSALDPYTLLPKATLGKTMTFADRNAASRLAFDKAGGADAGKPTFSAEAGGWIYRPDAQNPSGRIVKVDGLPDKPLNESQGAATNFGIRALRAHEALGQLKDQQPGTIKRTMQAMMPTEGLEASMGTLANFTQSKDQQAAEQLQNDFISAVLRKESGASISPVERYNAQKQYFPQPNDDKDTLALKKRNRETAIQGLTLQAGPGARHIKPSVPTTFQDPDKESRYQEWVRKNKG